MFIMYSGLGINENAQTSSINGFGGVRFVERFAEKEGRVIIGDDHIIKKTPQQVLQTDIIANFIQHFKTGMVPQQGFIILCYAKNATHAQANPCRSQGHHLCSFITLLYNLKM